jgi:hypothetical protein
MNELVYASLAKKAGSMMPKDKLIPYDYQLYIKLITELVVRECAEIADKGWADPGHQIKQHFGVEL